MLTQSEPQLEKMSSAERLKLNTVGRITGLPHIVELRFVRIEDAFYVFAGQANADWVLNALHSRTGKLTLQTWQFPVRASKAPEEEKNRAYSALKQKYGSRIVTDWYAESGLCLKLVQFRSPIPKSAVRGEGEAEQDYEAWKLRHRDYYLGIAEAFDSASEEYDFTIGHNFINTWIRRRSIEELFKITHKEDVLVEIGCGTGTEAILIAPYVSKIIASDISEKMLRILGLKLKARKLSRKILPIKARASEISTANPLLGEAKASLVYSFNGALNCEPQMVRFVRELSSILSKGGHFICSIRNNLCLSEAVSHALVLEFGKMAPRRKQPVMISVGGLDIPSTYFAPYNFTAYFQEDFDIKKQIALPGLLPPAYLNDYYLKLRRVAYPLERAERLLSQHWPLNWFGDQTLFIFQKK